MYTYVTNIIMQCVGEKKRMSKQFKRIHTYEECNVRITVSVGEKNEASKIFKNGIP